MDRSTITAVATPVGSGGIGIIKISGDNALSIAASIFRKSKSPPEALSDSLRDPYGPSGSSFKSHRLYYGHVVDPESGRILDEVLLSIMKAPYTYTREDVVEINAHSGPVAIRGILDLVLKKGARLAEPGEFTQRAYLNGRIDLTQAEAVIDIINAKTQKSLEIATAQVKGDMRECIEAIRGSMLEILTDIEAAIDFPEDVGDILDTARIVEFVRRNSVEPLNDLVRLHDDAHVLRDGLKLVVVGRPNVGKSSLMNRLLKKDRAIVTPVPGTTRDLIEETLNIRGIPVIISDTAGLHETSDPIEVIGISKAQECIDDSDLVLFMVDISEPLTHEDDKIYETIQGKENILVLNKIDLVDEDFGFEMPDTWRRMHSVRTSALYNIGFTELKDLIADVSVGEFNLETGNLIIPNLRQKIGLERALQAAGAATEGLQSGIPSELIAIDIEEAISALGEIIGITVKEDVLDQIFSRFCIGK
ncbi:tRNA uridine-5-carboxymethylaminomethyl(34) synthesis GTPase MnmE [Thermodesulfobacteriota bacterium]